MADMFDYLSWRGDILFSQLPPNNADALIFSTLAYISFDDIVFDHMRQFITLRQACDRLLCLEDPVSRCRVPSDLALLQAAAKTDRFGNVGLIFYQNVFVPEEDTQFAAVTFLLDDGTAFLSYRGTDSTLVGWKEDFNMTFQDSIAAQRLARDYAVRFGAATGAPLRLGGHSKGGNLAVYAAAKTSPALQSRVIEVFNHDGPGFTERMMTDPGYLNIVPKIRTFVPQSSVFGMLLEHEEPYTVIRSKQIGILQHDPYSWEIMGKDFIRVDGLTPDSQFLDRTFKEWLAGMTKQERSAFFDSIFDLAMAGGASDARDLLKPQNLRTFFKNLQEDETARTTIFTELGDLLESAYRVFQKSQESAQ